MRTQILVGVAVAAMAGALALAQTKQGETKETHDQR